ncbi:hypothetical protein NAEGRDRAFT_58542 [Naegleria gruberi]|uniref:Uncharacterized protein n=1 Tax=Naegleria gruberi TaxID=5762 RepID=D2VKW1_NAEGR|nr:uncharacterized protein NAEGRDRAFT_58542 [Naegleria gruberi]EFC42512.1 hypothetical protein NAEGRDRAFT_58542 [Naegleria gruberi]|eukprot:XP_002675256.1 hypothetical protein NAEGRDRAFT_58542 [Naegleria gruberi strain NEG-M]
MSTPTIVRKVSNVTTTGGNNNSVDSPTVGGNNSTASPPIRPSRVVRVLSSKSASTTTTNNNNSTTHNGTTFDNNNASSTSTVDQQQTSSSTESNNTPDVSSSTESANSTTSTTNGTTTTGAKKVVVRRVIVKRPVGEAAVPVSTPSNDNNNNTTTAPDENNSTTINNNNISSNNNNNNTNGASTTSSNEVNNNNTTTTTTTTTSTTATNTPTTPRTNVADRWLQRNTTTTTTATTPTTTEAPTTPKRRVRSINKPEEKTSDAITTTNTSTTTSTSSAVTTNGTTTTTTPENKNINSTNSEFGSKLVTAAKSHSTIVNTGTTATTGSPHQASKSMNDIPEQKGVKSVVKDLGNRLKLLTPEQLMMDKKMDRGSDVIRPLRPLEIATWYGGSVSVATEDPMFDNSSIDDLKKEGPDIYYTNFLFNPLFDEQSACDTPIITMSAQEVLQYNFVVESMKKKKPDLLTWDPIAFEEEMRNASSLSSLSLKNISSGQTHTDSVTSTEDVLSREDIGYPINKCSKNWKYQLKKKRENSKTNFNSTDGMFTPRASIQLQSSSPSSPATSNSAAVNPLFDHLYYMPCWKHQIQLDQIIKRGGEQRKVQ